jgi:nucleoporin NUP82
LHSSEIRGKIRQLAVSPNGSFIAILTSANAYAAILPDPALFSNASPTTRLLTFRLGSTSHRQNQTETARALWHPLGVAGSSLVTISIDAVVRIWELNIEDRSSFEQPTVVLDLVKLSNPSLSEGDDTYGSPASRNRGFSPDMIETEVASACFGGVASNLEDPWASMTLWVAMKEGDVYALCPLLPKRWQAHASHVPNLILSSAAHDVEDDEEEFSTDDVRRQHRWVSHLEQQDPLVFQPPMSTEQLQLFTTPKNPAVPKLQGPFSITPLAGESGETSLTDIYVIPSNFDVDSDEQASEVESDSQSEPAADIVCLATITGKIHVCVVTSAIEGQWISRKGVS